MSTLLKAYVRERPPRDWKALFREATNIGFMIKYALQIRVVPDHLGAMYL